MCSPIRSDDRVRSFVVFPASRGRGFDEFEFTWKDHGVGKTGNIFTLIKLMFGYPTFNEVYARINKDFELDSSLPTVESKIALFEKPVVSPNGFMIRSLPTLTRKGRTFWDNLSIGQELLDVYNVTQVEYIWWRGQEAPTMPLDPTFAYRIGQYYQLYSPYAARENKFRNNLPENYFFGYLQLPPEMDLLIIDKSAKDVIFNRRLGYWAVAGKSETTMIPRPFMLNLKKRAKRMLLMLDPDDAGVTQTEKYLKEYPWLEPKFLTDAKDKTDLRTKFGFEKSKQIIDELINS